MRDNDETFHLSLTEIAFLVILALVLLLGFPLKNKIQELNELQKCKVFPEDRMSVDPESFASQLLPCDRCLANVEKLSLRNAQQIREAGKKLVGNNEMSEQDFSRLLENLQKKGDMHRQVSRLIKENKSLSQQSMELKKSNQALKLDLNKALSEKDKLEGEKMRLQNRIDYGGDFPPCLRGQTLRANGKPFKWDNLFTVRMVENRVYVSYANEQARNHPSVDENLRNLSDAIVNRSQSNNGLSYSEYEVLANPIFDWSENHNPRCRLAVVLENRIALRKEADSRRLNHIESRFYKEERVER